MQEKTERHLDVVMAVVLAIGAIGYVCWRWSVTPENLQLPFVYMGFDDFETYVDVTNIRDTGWLWHSTRLGAPFGAEFHDFPVIFLHNFDELLFKVLLLFTSNVFEVVNIAFLLTPVFSSWAAYFVLRELRISRLLAACGALTFAFLPFYFLRNELHMMLTLYSFVPLVFWLCVFAYRGEILRTFHFRMFCRRDWLALFFCLLIANNGTAYWQAFSCFFLLITAILAATDRQDWHAGLPAMRALGIILVVFALCLTPAAYQNHVQGNNFEPAQRSAVEVDNGGLRLTAMLLPRELSWDKADRKVDAYHRDAHSDAATYIGPLAAVGVIFLFVPLFWRKEWEDVTGLFSRLTLAALLLAMVGGVASIVTVFLAPGVLLRVYYRISIYLAFMGIWLVCFSLGRWQFGKKYKKLFLVGVVCLFAWNLLAQYPQDDSRDYVAPKDALPSFSPPDYARIRSDFTSDRDFVQYLEAELPAGAMIYQLPYHRFPEGGAVERMFDYQLFIGFLHSRQLRWSYGGMKGRPGDLWPRELAQRPMAEQISQLRATGFAGIYVDCRAYKPEALQALTEELTALLGEDAQMSSNGNLAFWRL